MADISASKYQNMRQSPSESSWLRKKPLWQVHQEIEQSHQHGGEGTLSSVAGTQPQVRHLTLLDLISVGVGGTVGSGIFVLTGFIAHNFSGPATSLSFAIAGVAAAGSGVCYAELSGRIPCAGSTYVYSYVCMGEAFAVVAGACLTLEYGVSGAAVARSWGDKMVEWARVQLQMGDAAEEYLQPHGVNLMAGLVSLVSVALLTAGVHESKLVTNFFTITKLCLVVFMTIGGFALFQVANIHGDAVPFAPFGVSGICRGATSSFFGYLGYDEVCCIAGEALHPQKDMPRAVLWTLLIVTVLYILASFALTGMLPYDQISDTSGFPSAFEDRGIHWAAHISAFGEVFTLPVVVLISLMAQPRLQLAMARDGLLPAIFAKTDETGNLRWGTFLSGSAMVIVATFVPFSYLDDLISVGILVAFSMTNSCLILMRCESPPERPGLVEKHLMVHNGLCLMAGLLFVHTSHTVWGATVSACSVLAVGGVVLSLAWHCPKTTRFGQSFQSSVVQDEPGQAEEYFQTPFVPYLPCMGIFVNWFLVAQLEISGLLMLFLYLGITLTAYGCCCSTGTYEHVSLSSDEDGQDDDAQPIKGEIALSTLRARTSLGHVGDTYPIT